MKNSHPLIYYIHDGSLLMTIVKQYGSPLYLYSADRIRKNLSKLDNALNCHFQKYQIFYAVKSNSNPHLIQLMKTHLPKLRADCSSPGEIHAAKLAGIQSIDCIYTGNYESPKDLKVALDAGAYINLDDITSFHRLAAIRLPEKLSFRLNPGFGKGSFAQVVTRR